MTPRKPQNAESGRGDRLERLSKALKANIGRRKAQARQRTANENNADDDAPALPQASTSEKERC